MKKIFYGFILILSIFICGDVYAQTCEYKYVSRAYGETSATIEINGTTAKGVITTMNGDSKSNNEKVQGWSSTVSIYNSKNQVCPYYLLVETSGPNATIRAGYDYNELAAYIGKVGVGDEKEAHVCVSKTIEEDKKKAGDAYNDTTDSGKGDDSNIQNDKVAVKTCGYETDKSEASLFGSSTGYLKIFEDGTYEAYVTKFKGTAQGFWTHDHFSNPDVSSDALNLIKQKKCPYYMIADYDGINSVKFTNSKESSTTEKQVMVSEEIAENKEDYDPEKDGQAEDLDEKLERADRANEGVKESILDPLDQDDPFNGEHIGDDICGEERVVKALRALGLVLMFARFAIPLIIIVMGTFDFIKAVLAGTQETLAKQAKALGWRVVIGLFIMFAPTLVSAFLSGLHAYGTFSNEAEACQKCLFNPFKDGSCQSSTDAKRVTNVDAPETGTIDKTVEAGSLTDNKGKVTAIDGEMNGNRDASVGNIDGSRNASAGQTDNSRNVSTGQTNNDRSVSVGDTTSPRGQVIVEDPDYTKQANIN